MRWLTTLLVSIGLVGFLAAANCKRIPPDQIGIKIRNIPSRGIDLQDYDAGFYRSIWLVESWDALPRSVQRIAFTDRSDLRGPIDSPAIDAKTQQGDTVKIEAEILVRIAEGKGHMVYNSAGPGDAFKRLANKVAAPEIANSFATIRNEEIYDAKKRRETYEALEKKLREKLLSQNYLDLIRVAITTVSYDPKYEEQLEKKKVATQNQYLEISRQKRAEEAGIRNIIIQETDNLVKKIQSDLSSEKRKITSVTEASIADIRSKAQTEAGNTMALARTFRLEREAAGTQLVKEAEAYAVDLQRKAVGENAANWIAYLTAQTFPVRSVQMSSFGVDWLSPLALARQAGALMQQMQAAGSSGK